MSQQNLMPHIVADYREERSGIPGLLSRLGCRVKITGLKAGDYIINDSIIVERKTKDDFVLSLLQGRLFKQCLLLRKSGYVLTFLIEGNPYHTPHDVSKEAIRGALLSVSLSWQIPVNYSANIHDTAEILMTMAQQHPKDTLLVQRHGYKPKTLRKRQLYFLQGLPLIGPKLANELLDHFGTLKRIVNAGEDELAQVPGIGKGKAKKIWEFLQ